MPKAKASAETKKDIAEMTPDVAETVDEDEVMLKSGDVGAGMTSEEAAAPVAEVSTDAVESASAAPRRELPIAAPQYIFKQVKSLVFGVLSPKMIKKMASAKIVTPELYDKEGYPVDGGLMDIRLGVIDPGLRCKTCGCKLKECIGHFGYIELARPVVHIKFVPVILSLLRSTCHECGKVLIPKEKIEKAKNVLSKIEREGGLRARRKAIKTIIDSLKAGAKCAHCNAKQAKVNLEKPTTFVEGERRVSPIEVRARLEKIPDEDAALFGLNPKTARPEWMILTVLPVPPVTMRPSITLETGERSEDDLTHKMGDIVRINQRLFENINAGAPEIIIEDLWDLLQYHVTTFFDNDVAQLPPARHRSGQPLKTLTERIKSKEGRIRHNLAGKRTNFCARTVISPDARIKVNEVGVPKVIAMKVTVPEVVQAWNMVYLKKFIERGPHTYPGANYVVRPDGKKKKITEETKEAAIEELQPGYVVERHMMDGDITIFNRQPCLHRMSTMCHRVKVLPGRTLRLNPTVCAPYNADFDGDEMNLHVPQTEESRAEAEILMDVQTQIISPRYGLPVIGGLQDALSGNFALTRGGEMPREEAIEFLIHIGLTDVSKLPHKKTVNGREIFSVLMPDDFNFNGTSRAGTPVVIKDGKLVEGVIDENSLGEGSGHLLRALHRQYGSEKTIDLLYKIFTLGNEFLQKTGFSCHISDYDLPSFVQEQIEATINEAENEIQGVIQQFHDGKLEAFPGRSIGETLEFKILELLNKARNKAGQIVREHAKKDTDTRIMVDSGARGNILQLSQISAIVGQQALRGKRIEKGYRGRTLSCFKRGDISPLARGFVRNNFKRGLTAQEFFFCSITGRDSLMDTALRTPKSGYLYRRLANAMQDLRVEYDGTVRDATGKIIQFAYGEDNIDVSRSEAGKINIKRIIESVD
jgi:DNA-directed RNA polymerase subunit A'